MAVEWKMIGELTDKTVLGIDGLSDKAPRKKSRAILINEYGQMALMHEKKTNLYALPGGAIEAGEDELSALVREVSEETGCLCDEIAPLGMIYENRFHADTTHLSYFFVVRTKGERTAPRLTDEEAELGTTLKWCSLEEAVRLIKDVDHDTRQKKFLQARDLLALNEYIRVMK